MHAMILESPRRPLVWREMPLPALRPEQRVAGRGVTMELWDPFFGAMKSTQLLLTQLPMPWEADVDLRSNTWETLLGLG
jgi:hypothetical protein